MFSYQIFVIAEATPDVDFILQDLTVSGSGSGLSLPVSSLTPSRQSPMKEANPTEGPAVHDPMGRTRPREPRRPHEGRAVLSPFEANPEAVQSLADSWRGGLPLPRWLESR